MKKSTLQIIFFIVWRIFSIIEPWGNFHPRSTFVEGRKNFLSLFYDSFEKISHSNWHPKIREKAFKIILPQRERFYGGVRGNKKKLTIDIDNRVEQEMEKNTTSVIACVEKFLGSLKVL